MKNKMKFEVEKNYMEKILEINKIILNKKINLIDRTKIYLN